MWFASTKHILFVLVLTFTTVSIVCSLSIPHAREYMPMDLVKRATTDTAKAATGTTRRVSGPSASSSNHAQSSSLPHTTDSAANSLNNSASDVPASSGPAPAVNLTMSSNSTTPTSPLNATMTNTTTSTPVPTGGLSTPAVGAIAAIGGVAVIGAGIFAFMRYKRKASLTQDLGNKSVNQFSAPYNSSAAFPAGGNTGYERLSDPQLSVPIGGGGGNGASQQSLGTYTVISTYTPTLGDELEIQAGDKVTILVEYDDGWCQGVNESRGKVKGVFPKHCVDYNQGNMDETGRGKRVSSMYGSGYRM